MMMMMMMMMMMSILTSASALCFLLLLFIYSSLSISLLLLLLPLTIRPQNALLVLSMSIVTIGCYATFWALCHMLYVLFSLLLLSCCDGGDDDDNDEDEYTNLCLCVSAFCSFYSYTPHLNHSTISTTILRHQTCSIDRFMALCRQSHRREAT